MSDSELAALLGEQCSVAVQCRDGVTEQAGPLLQLLLYHDYHQLVLPLSPANILILPHISTQDLILDIPKLISSEEPIKSLFFKDWVNDNESESKRKELAIDNKNFNKNQVKPSAEIVPKFENHESKAHIVEEKSSIIFQSKDDKESFSKRMENIERIINLRVSRGRN